MIALNIIHPYRPPLRSHLTAPQHLHQNKGQQLTMDSDVIQGYVFNTRKQDYDYPCASFELWLEVFADETASDDEVRDACTFMMQNVAECEVTEVYAGSTCVTEHHTVRYTLTSEPDDTDTDTDKAIAYPTIHPCYPDEPAGDNFIGWRIVVHLKSVETT